MTFLVVLALVALLSEFIPPHPINWSTASRNALILAGRGLVVTLVMRRIAPTTWLFLGKWNKRSQAQGAVSKPNGLKLSKLGSVRSFGSRNARSRVGANIGSVCHPVFASKYRTAVATEG